MGLKFGVTHWKAYRYDIVTDLDISRNKNRIRGAEANGTEHKEEK